MNRLEEIKVLSKKIRDLAKETWGEEYLDCDCGHDTETCKCDCYMCEKGWQLTEMNEIHKWEEMLLPIITERDRPIDIQSNLESNKGDTK